MRSAAGPFAVTRLDVMLEQYLAEAASPYTGEPWKNSYLTQTRRARGREDPCRNGAEGPRSDAPDE